VENEKGPQKKRKICPNRYFRVNKGNNLHLKLLELIYIFKQLRWNRKKPLFGLIFQALQSNTDFTRIELVF